MQRADCCTAGGPRRQAGKDMLMKSLAPTYFREVLGALVVVEWMELCCVPFGDPRGNEG